MSPASGAVAIGSFSPNIQFLYARRQFLIAQYANWCDVYYIEEYQLLQRFLGVRNGQIISGSEIFLADYTQGMCWSLPDMQRYNIPRS